MQRFIQRSRCRVADKEGQCCGRGVAELQRRCRVVDAEEFLQRWRYADII